MHWDWKLHNLHLKTLKELVGEIAGLGAHFYSKIYLV